MPCFEHLNIVTADMERALAFYVGGLGLSVTMDRMLEGPWFERLIGRAGVRARCVIVVAPKGGCRLELLQFADAGADCPEAEIPTTLGLRHFALQVEDLDASLARLGITAEVVEVPRDIVTAGKRMTYIHDPDGVVVELCEYRGTP